MEDEERYADSKMPLMEYDEGEGPLKAIKPHNWLKVIVGITTLFVYTALVVFATRHLYSTSPPRSRTCKFKVVHIAIGVSYSLVPPQDVVLFEERVFPAKMFSPFTGEPNSESDAAWHELVKSKVIKLPYSIAVLIDTRRQHPRPK